MILETVRQYVNKHTAMKMDADIETDRERRTRLMETGKQDSKNENAYTIDNNEFPWTEDFSECEN